MSLQECIDAYGNIPLFFKSYYKYTFSFFGETEEVDITAQFGGNADDVYKYDVDADVEEFLEEGFKCIIVKDKKTGKVIFEYTDF